MRRPPLFTIARESRESLPLRELVRLLDADLNSRHGIIQGQYDQYNSLAMASLILAELERWSVEAGLERAILETGNLQPEAIRFYAKSGYSQIDNYGQYVGMEHSVCMAKQLV